MTKKKYGSTFADTIKALLFGRRTATLSILEEEQVQSPYRTMLRNFREKWSAMLGVYIFLAIFLMVFILPIFFPMDIQFQDPTQKNTKPTFAFMRYPKELKNKVTSLDGGSVFGVGSDIDGHIYQWGTLSPKLKSLPNITSKVV